MLQHMSIHIPFTQLCMRQVRHIGSFFLFLRFSLSSIFSASAAACARPTSLSLRQRLFPSLVEPLEVPDAPLDITHTPTAQELLVHKVLQSLEEEKGESKRYSNYAALRCFIQVSCISTVLTRQIYTVYHKALILNEIVHCWY